MTLHIATRFDIGDTVQIDGGDVRAVIISIEIRPNQVERYEVSWWHNGDVKFAVLDHWRLLRIHSCGVEQPG